MPDESPSEKIIRVIHTESITHTVTDSVENDIASPEQRHSPRKEILRQVPFGVLICTLVAAAAVCFQQTDVGKEFGFFTYRVLQGRLTDSRHPEGVTLIDIGNLRPDAQTGITPRRPLEDLISAVAKQKPAAIGVDIDFSPDGDRVIDPEEDMVLFTLCEALWHKDPPIRVYLGIYRSQNLAPSRWLGFPMYENLAADLLVPTVPERSVWSISDVKSSSEKDVANAAPKAPTMSSALASSFRDSRKKGTWERLRQYLFGQLLEEHAGEITIQEFYIDYSALTRLAKISIQDFSVSSLETLMNASSEELRGKAVLIGDANHAEQEDVFQSPVSDKALPGVLVQASATNTLINSPLYAFPEINEFWLDLIFGLFVLALIVFVRLIFAEKVNEEKLTFLATFGVAGLVFLFGWSVNHTRVFWPDFLLLTIGLILHPSAHRRCEKCKEQFLRWIRQPEDKRQ